MSDENVIPDESDEPVEVPEEEPDDGEDKAGPVADVPGPSGFSFIPDEDSHEGQVKGQVVREPVVATGQDVTAEADLPRSP